MPSPYQGNAVSSQSPSPAPGPGVKPTASLPVDADARNAASVAQMAKVPMDFIAHIQSSVQLATPQVPAAGVGFTARTYTSFGGTVAPTGSVKISTGTNFVIKIILGGAVATATFQTSIDGGNTFGATQTTAASMTDATSGITLAFSGTFTLGGTAQFFSAFTPQAAWADSIGNLRHVIDHNGFPMGGMRSEWREELRIPPGAGANGVITNNPALRASMSGTGIAMTFAAPSAVFPFCPSVILNPGTAGGASTFICSSTSLFLTHKSTGPSAVMEWQVALSAIGIAASSDWYFGFSDAFGLPSTNGMFFAKLHNVANWQSHMVYNTTVTDLDLGVAPVVNTPQRFRLEYHADATAIGIANGGLDTQLFFINEQLVAVYTRTFTVLGFYFTFGGFYSTGAGGETATVSPWLVTWNRASSLPQL